MNSEKLKARAMESEGKDGILSKLRCFAIVKRREEENIEFFFRIVASGARILYVQIRKISKRGGNHL
jgi:hypothetical protein